MFSPDGVSTAYLMTDLAVELKKLGHNVSVLSTTPHYNIDQSSLDRQPMRKCWGGWVYRSELDGIPVWHVKLPMKRQRFWTRAIDYMRFHLFSILLSLRSIGKQDIVIATSPPLTMGILSWLLALRWRAKAVYKVAEVYPDLAVRQGLIQNPVLIGLMRWMERWVYRRNDMIVSIAETFTKVIRSRGVPDSKLLTISDCVDTELFRPLNRNNSFSKNYRLTGDFVVLYGGNIGSFQDWSTVLAAADALRHLPVKFVIVGDGRRGQWVADEVKRLGLANFQMVEYQPKALMPEINASCDLGLIPMTLAGARDGFPSKVYSIMACAKPVIVTAEVDSEMAGIIQVSNCGFVVPPEQPHLFIKAVELAYSKRDQLREMGNRGRSFVEISYSKQAIGVKYDALIRDLVGDREKSENRVNPPLSAFWW